MKYLFILVSLIISSSLNAEPSCDVRDPQELGLTAYGVNCYKEFTQQNLKFECVDYKKDVQANGRIKGNVKLTSIKFDVHLKGIDTAEDPKISVSLPSNSELSYYTSRIDYKKSCTASFRIIMNKDIEFIEKIKSAVTLTCPSIISINYGHEDVIIEMADIFFNEPLTLYNDVNYTEAIDWKKGSWVK